MVGNRGLNAKFLLQILGGKISLVGIFLRFNIWDPSGIVALIFIYSFIRQIRPFGILSIIFLDWLFRFIYLPNYLPAQFLWTNVFGPKNNVIELRVSVFDICSFVLVIPLGLIY